VIFFSECDSTHGDERLENVFQQTIEVGDVWDAKSRDDLVDELVHNLQKRKSSNLELLVSVDLIIRHQSTSVGMARLKWTIHIMLCDTLLASSANMPGTINAFSMHIA
jgi:hypothetical protein